MKASNTMGAFMMSILARHRVELDPEIKVIEPRTCPQCKEVFDHKGNYCSVECHSKAKATNTSPLAGRRKKKR